MVGYSDKIRLVYDSVHILSIWKQAPDWYGTYIHLPYAQIYNSLNIASQVTFLLQ